MRTFVSTWRISCSVRRFNDKQCLKTLQLYKAPKPPKLTIQQILDQSAAPMYRKANIKTINTTTEPSEYQFELHEALSVIKAYSVCFWKDYEVTLLMTSGLDSGV